MPRLICISDTHSKHYELDKDLPEGDIIIHAGDFSNRGHLNELSDFLGWFSNLNYKHKIFIAGNHDFIMEKAQGIAYEYQEKGVIYLRDEMVEVEGLKIYGTPWQPRFFDWAFNVDRGEAIAKKWASIPEGLDVLIVHGPPHGILDALDSGMRVGCEELYKRIWEVKPKLMVFGHIHSAYGMSGLDGVTFINASSLDERYEYNRNKPIIFDF